jgi:hydrogenase expression/formation protein HypE
VANEGKFVAVVAPEDVGRALDLMRAHPLGRQAAVVGRIEGSIGGLVTMTTGLGAQRIVHMPLGEQLPRIC